MHPVIIFDFFGVICSEVAPYWIRDYLSEADEQQLHSTLIKEVDVGRSSPDALFTALGEKARMSATEVADGWQTYIHINTELVDYIKELKATHRIALCSNAWSSFIRPILEANDLYDLFETVTISSEVGHVKPDKAMYLQTVSDLAVDPAECLFVDDNQRNVDAAMALGMDGHHFQSVSDLKDFLTRHES